MTLKGVPTKEEVIGVVVQKLDLRKPHTVIDIGCGSGAVSKELSKIASEVIGIDKRPKAIELSKSKCSSCNFIQGYASELIPRYGKYDRAFIGGTKNLENFFPKLIQNMEEDGKIVANASRIEVALKIQRLMGEIGIHDDTILIQISNFKELGDKTSFSPKKPVFMVVGKC